MSMPNSNVAKLLAPLFKKTMLDTYANFAFGEPWPINWFVAPGLPDPTIGRKRRARRARGKTVARNGHNPPAPCHSGDEQRRFADEQRRFALARK